MSSIAAPRREGSLAFHGWPIGSVLRRNAAVEHRVNVSACGDTAARVYMTRKPGQPTFSLNVHRPVNRSYFAPFCGFRATVMSRVTRPLNETAGVKSAAFEAKALHAAQCGDKQRDIPSSAEVRNARA